MNRVGTQTNKLLYVQRSFIKINLLFNSLTLNSVGKIKNRCPFLFAKAWSAESGDFHNTFKQLTLEKSDSLGTKSRRKRLRDYLGERGTKAAALFSFYPKEISMGGDLS